MPLEWVSPFTYKPIKSGAATWDDFKGGLNNLLGENEIGDSDLAQSDNIILTGKGMPTKRWGTANYFLAGPSGRVNCVEGYYTTSTNELLSLGEHGYLTKKSGASYAIITGASFASSSYGEMVQLNNKMYIVNGLQALTKYDGSGLTRFTALTQPTNVSATNLSGVSGSYSYSWRVSAEGFVGETLASNRITLSNLPDGCVGTSVQLTWSCASPASSVAGYVVYGRDTGDERFLARIPSNATVYYDTGSDSPAILAEPPTSDTTAGPVAKYIERHDNRLVMAGMTATPNRVIFSGRASFAEYFHWSKGGGYIDIDTDSGDMITGIKSYQNKLIIFKERSVWEVELNDQTIGNYTITVPTAILVTGAHGCVSHKTVVPVENDLFFLTREGVFVLGYEPNIQDVLRTNEVSAKIRNSFEGKGYTDISAASAEYFDKKYVLSFRDSEETLVYDRERLCWVGEWDTYFGICDLEKYYDSAGTEKWLAGVDDSYVVDFSPDYVNDRLTAFTTSLKTKKEDFGAWNAFKYVGDMFLRFKSVSGQVDINITIETKDGESNIVADFELEEASTSVGWGGDGWASNQWGDSSATATASDLSEFVKRILINRSVRSIQVNITTDGASDDYELLGVSINAKPQGRGSMPYSWIVQ